MLHVELLHVCLAVDFQILLVYNEMRMGRKKPKTQQNSLSEMIWFIFFFNSNGLGRELLFIYCKSGAASAGSLCHSLNCQRKMHNTGEWKDMKTVEPSETQESFSCA